MQVLLRHLKTGHYYRGASEWAMGKADAVDFGSLEQAMEIVAREKLDGMSMVVRYDESGKEQVFDLSQGIPAKEPVKRIGSQG